MGRKTDTQTDRYREGRTDCAVSLMGIVKCMETKTDRWTDGQKYR